jgi:hypothetical protein
MPVKTDVSGVNPIRELKRNTGHPLDTCRRALFMADNDYDLALSRLKRRRPLHLGDTLLTRVVELQHGLKAAEMLIIKLRAEIIALKDDANTP